MSHAFRLSADGAAEQSRAPQILKQWHANEPAFTLTFSTAVQQVADSVYKTNRLIAGTKEKRRDKRGKWVRKTTRRTWLEEESNRLWSSRTPVNSGSFRTWPGNLQFARDRKTVLTAVCSNTLLGTRCFNACREKRTYDWFFSFFLSVTLTTLYLPPF